MSNVLPAKLSTILYNKIKMGITKEDGREGI